mmetsp:Transcript_14923/g.21748  ORF Transcript_14923/g.21748 Transcript_14923/m.21748 type:complete len:267 (-) Transcript_14923:473-1273(-)
MFRPSAPCPTLSSTTSSQTKKQQTSGGAAGGNAEVKGSVGGEALPAVATYVENSARPPPTGSFVSGGFDMALMRILDEPQKHEKSIVMQDAKCLVIYDAYPKARYHLLVLPKEKVMSISDLRLHHLPLIQHMHRVALHVIAAIRGAGVVGQQGVEGHRPLAFRIGYHCVPSLKLLHLHIVSADFVSTCLKHKKHWNSFQPPFFLDSKLVEQTISDTGKVEVDKHKSEALLKAPLTSHRTSETIKNIPRLKEHLIKCSAPVSSGVVY